MKKFGIWLAAAGIGVINAVLLYGFEFIGIEGTVWLWNDILQTDTNRVMVIVAAVGLSIILTATVRSLGEKRLIQPEDNLLAELDDSNSSASLQTIGSILLIGAISLLAGASLGPEAALMAASAAIGVLVASRYKLGSAKQLLILASVGALLVAFLGSILMVLVPLLMLLQKKQLKWRPAGIILLASVTSYGVIWLIDRQDPGYGTVPPLPTLAGHDYVVALVAGFATTALALILNWLIKRFWKLATAVDKRVPWYASAAFFGLALGGIYLLGGETIRFSGSIGSQLLTTDAAQYGVAALAGLIITKLLATSWSKATGFRGGLVFPSIYIGIALGLFIGQLLPEWGGAGAIIGGIAGMLSAITGSAVVAAIFVIAILPVQLLPVALCAIAGTVVFRFLSKQLFTQNKGNG